MSTARSRKWQEHEALPSVRQLADQAFARAAGAPLIAGNDVRILIDAKENYPAWLAAIHAARQSIHFECYMIYEDETGAMFADALIAKAREGVRVRLIYDWLGTLGETSRRFWDRLRASGVEVRCYNPPRLDSPLGWLSRDHRKMLAVDGQIGFVTGLCIGDPWAGNPARGIEPWRDTGVEIKGPAVADIERAFAQVWAMTGDALPADELTTRGALAPAGEVSLRVVASVPQMAGMFRLDQLVAALAREKLWLTDAYFVATSVYTQALRAAAIDGADVRLLVPGTTDVPALQPLSRAAYRPLLKVGIRVFEWNGPMMHAKTAVADGRWTRIGSTNLNIASWLGNCELDVAIEDEHLAAEMERAYGQDLENATEIVLDTKHKVRGPRKPVRTPRGLKSGSGSANRATVGVLNFGTTVGAAITERRVLGHDEKWITLGVGAALLALSLLLAFFPRLLAYPLAVIFAWLALALLYRGYRLHRKV